LVAQSCRQNCQKKTLKKKIFVLGGAGYVGSFLVPILLKKNYLVTVYDLFMYGDTIENNKNLKKIKGDLRNIDLLNNSIIDHDIVIHLACISNDPSFDLNPELSKSINFDFFEDFVKISKEQGIKRFIYASSSSVYGVKEEKEVDENFSLEPITDYSKFKVKCEEVLLKYFSNNFICSILRPATVCGYSKRQRLDLIVNILTNIAYHTGKIIVDGGSQYRPNINIKDMCDAYVFFLDADEKLINGQIYNVGFENYTVNELACMVQSVIGKKVEIVKNKLFDQRSYHISSKKISKFLGFNPKFKIQSAIEDLKIAFDQNFLKDPLNNEMYFNIKRMKSINLS